MAERAKKRSVHRTTFTSDQRTAIVARQPELGDRVALRLLLDYGLRKGARQRVQFKHFDHARKRLTIFTKGEKIRDVPIPQPAFWFDLERVILESGAEPHHYLLARRKSIPHTDPETGQLVPVLHRFPTSRWGPTARTTGGTPASPGPGSSRRERPAASGCTRPAITPASGSWTGPGT